jgi:CSLREA domain-containing protein
MRFEVLALEFTMDRFLFGLFALGLWFFSATVQAQAPANDLWSGRIAIPPAALVAGFTNVQSTIGMASTDATDPALVCKAFGDPLQRGNTVWYRLDLSASAGPVYLNTAATGYDSVLAVFVGNPTDGFAAVGGACNDDGAVGFAAQLNGIRLLPGADYSIMVARLSQNSGSVTLTFSARNAPLYVVNQRLDTVDGACNADCSLREAVNASNAVPGAILLPVGDFELTRSGADNSNVNGDLDLSQGMGIYGVGTSTRISGLSGERVFDLDPTSPANIGRTVNFADLVISNGSGNGPGAGINASSADDYTALYRVILENNESALLQGGGMHSAGPTLVLESIVRNNSAAGNGAGLAFTSSGANVRTEVLRSTIEGNNSTTASAGGGGGIYGSSQLFVVDSTVSGNKASFSGGGVVSTTTTGRLTMRNSSVVDNRADTDANGAGVGGGIRIEGNNAVIYNTVGAGNLTGALAEDCSKSAQLLAVTLLNNHMEAPAGAAGNCGFAGGNNVQGVPAQLGPLADNGGVGQTHYPLASSPLIDSGDPATCTAQDQIGTARPVDGDALPGAICDKGAVEYLQTNSVDALFNNGFES